MALLLPENQTYLCHNPTMPPRSVKSQRALLAGFFHHPVLEGMESGALQFLHLGLSHSLLENLSLLLWWGPLAWGIVTAAARYIYAGLILGFL